MPCKNAILAILECGIGVLDNALGNAYWYSSRTDMAEKVNMRSVRVVGFMLPYTISPVPGSPTSFIVLNRWYKPVGYTDTETRVDYAKTVHTHIAISDVLAFCTMHENMYGTSGLTGSSKSGYYLFDDATSPFNSKNNAQALLDKLEILATVLYPGVYCI